MADKAVYNRKRFFDVVAEKGGKVHSDYVNYSTKVELECASSHRWASTPSHIANGGSWCPKCPKSTSIKSKEKFLQVLKEKGGTLMTDYVNTNTHVTIKCHQGHEWNVTPHSIVGVMDSWCPACSNNCPKQAADKFYAKVAEHGGAALGTYQGAYTPVMVRCGNSHTWNIIPHSLISSNTWCARCYGNSPDQAREKFYQIIAEKKGTALQPYVNTYTRVRIRCRNEHEWNAIPGSINYGDWCRACAGTCPIESYKRLCRIVEENEGEMLEKYTNTQTKTRFKCKYGHIWETCPDNITNSGCWCPICKASHGERCVHKILKKYNMEFTEQKVHPSLPGYHYDFHFIHDGKEFYVEYDGRQHFEFVEYFHKTQEMFQYRRDIDVVKSRHVINSGACIVRLDYTLSDDDMEDHIFNALENKTTSYLSNPTMYNWILEGVNSPATISPQPTISLVPTTPTTPTQDRVIITQAATQEVNSSQINQRVEPKLVKLNIVKPTLDPPKVKLTLNIIKPQQSLSNITAVLDCVNSK